MKNKTYVVVGGSSGIGLEISGKIAQNGGIVYVYARNSIESEDNTNLHFTPLDVTSGELEIENIPEIIDGLVYCPGTINLKPFRRLTEEDFLNDYKINVTGAVKVIQKFYPALRKSNHASIVLFSSVAAKTGMNFHSSIAAAKGAVEGLVRSLAAEFSPAIRVNAIAPSLTNTPLAATLLSSDAKQKSSAEMHPLKRYGQPGDQADAALFLLSPASSWITGQILAVDGGLSSVRV
ncbi:MAG: SDR family oxidoreductase [Sphingobacteriia bacterium]|nr:SDR family oxidoreductase [Sphingobacteriia bacterium]